MTGTTAVILKILVPVFWRQNQIRIYDLGAMIVTQDYQGVPMVIIESCQSYHQSIQKLKSHHFNV